MKQKRNNEVWRPTKSEFPQTPLVRFVSKYGEIENKQYNNHHSLCGIETADTEFVYLVDMSSVVFFPQIRRTRHALHKTLILSVQASDPRL